MNRLILTVFICMTFCFGYANTFNMGGNHSKSYYSSQNTYLTAKVGTQSLPKAAQAFYSGSQASKWDREAKEELQKYYKSRGYDLDKVGETIGVRLDGAFAREVVQQNGIAGLNLLIEDRIFHLSTDLKLAKALDFSLAGQGPRDLTKDALSLDKPMQNFNPYYVQQIIDFLRRNPYYEYSNKAAEDFLESIKGNNAAEKKIFLSQSVSEEDRDRITKYLFYVVQYSLEDSGSVDFDGLNFDNMADNGKAIDSIANSFNRNIWTYDSHLTDKLTKCASEKKKIWHERKTLKPKDIAYLCEDFKSVNGKKSPYASLVDRISKIDARINVLRQEYNNSWVQKLAFNFLRPAYIPATIQEIDGLESEKTEIYDRMETMRNNENYSTYKDCIEVQLDVQKANLGRGLDTVKDACRFYVESSEGRELLLAQMNKKPAVIQPKEQTKKQSGEK